MAVQIGARPDSGFDDPIGMLKDCHRRIERFLEILCQVAQQAQGRALKTDERNAVEAALRYFSESGPRHNMDEEESLFPRLREVEATAVLGEVRRLESEHQEGGVLHEKVAKLYSKWIAEEALSVDEGMQLDGNTEKLQKIYREHIQIEEDVVFPMAATVLDRNAVAAMGAEFKNRRGRI